MKTVKSGDVVRTARAFLNQGFLKHNHSRHIWRVKIIFSLLEERNKGWVNADKKKIKAILHILPHSALLDEPAFCSFNLYSIFRVSLIFTFLTLLLFPFPALTSALLCIFHPCQPYSAVQFILDFNCNPKNYFFYSLSHVKTRDKNIQLNTQKTMHIHTLAASVSIWWTNDVYFDLISHILVCLFYAKDLYIIHNWARKWVFIEECMKSYWSLFIIITFRNRPLRHLAARLGKWLLHISINAS